MFCIHFSLKKLWNYIERKWIEIRIQIDIISKVPVDGALSYSNTGIF